MGDQESVYSALYKQAITHSFSERAGLITNFLYKYCSLVDQKTDTLSNGQVDCITTNNERLWKMFSNIDPKITDPVVNEFANKKTEE